MSKDLKFSGPLVGFILAKQEREEAEAKKAELRDRINKLLNKGGKK